MCREDEARTSKDIPKARDSSLGTDFKQINFIELRCVDKHVELWGNTRKELLYNRVNFKMSLLRTRNEMLPKAVRCLNRILQKPLVNSAVVASPVLIRNCCGVIWNFGDSSGLRFQTIFFLV